MTFLKKVMIFASPGFEEWTIILRLQLDFWYSTQCQSFFFNLQETYPSSAPIWFAESEDAILSAAISKLCDTTPDKFNVREPI